ncbi:AAA family ATPase [Pedobacter sp. ASV1-7]|uniref:AAA family ATPase n=1 Tax=Pedobacter sp. ASV1-7 TaxID=3145237 RepID=UPI0032E91B2C
MIIKNNFYIITGGPGVGKTTLINELQQQQMNCIPEVAREIIKDQLKNNGQALPWKNAKEYSKLMLSDSVRDFVKLLDANDLYFFDRGIPDTYAYECLMSFDYDESLNLMVNKYRYNNVVFILPPWEEIYKTDNERKQDFQLAKETYNVIKDTYESLDYDLIEVPCLAPAERAEFIIKTLNN